MESTFQEKKTEEIKIEKIEVPESERILEEDVKKDRREIQSVLKTEKLVMRTPSLAPVILDAIQAQRFNSSQNLCYGNGDGIIVDNRFLPKSEWGSRNLNKDNFNFVFNFFDIKKEISKNFQEKRSCQKNIIFKNKKIFLSLLPLPTIKPILDAIQAQRFNSSQNLCYGNGDGIIVDNRFLPKSEWGGLNIGSKENNNILTFFENVDTFKRAKDISRSNLNTINKINIKYIPLFKNDSNLTILDAIQAQRFNSSQNLCYGNGDGIIVDNRFLPKSEWDIFNKTDESLRKLYKEIFMIAASDLPSGMKESIISYLREPEDSIMDRMNQIMEDQQKNDGFIEIEKILNEINAIKRRNEFTQDFLEQLIENTQTETVNRLIKNFEQKDNEDITLVGELFEIAEITIKYEKLKNAFDLFEDISFSDEYTKREFDKAFACFRDIIDSNFSLALPYLEQIAEYEVSLFKKTILDKISADVFLEEYENGIRQEFSIIPDRPAVGNVNYISEIESFKKEIEEILLFTEKLKRFNRAVEIRESFPNERPQRILQDIEKSPQETQEDIVIKKQLLTFYKNYVAEFKPADFDAYFGNEISVRILKKIENNFINPEKGRNKDSMQYVRTNFIKTLFPLVEFYKNESDEEIQKVIASVLNNPSEKRKYEQRLANLATQRLLSDRETEYLKSVELLSLFNPYIVTTLLADFGITQEFLKHHFEKLSEKTLDNFQDGSFVPLLVIGTGPSGLAAIGEIVRNNAELARQTLVIDEGKTPGGPFAIPEGPAWELNSANQRGKTGYVLPDAVGDIQEKQSVRGYGSPLRYYPGERKAGEAIRGGSINTTVDYLPVPDNLSTARYPTNEELQSVLAVQSAMLVSNLLLTTKVLKVEPNTNNEVRGTEKVTIQILDKNGEKETRTMYTDAIISSTGLGEPNLGITLPGSRAEKILEQQKELKGFPRISTTLEAFNEVASRYKENSTLGETIVIYGEGNSADTLIEFIGNIFNSLNPRVRETTKIYVIAKGKFSSRPRYSLISDLRSRNGRGNLVEVIEGRVTDVGLTEVENINSPLNVYGSDGNIIKNKQGEEIKASSVIAATGFRPELTQIFSAYLQEGGDLNKKIKTGTKPLTLPTNEKIVVAETLESNPNILLVGTASNPSFNLEKYTQLPTEAREALLRNGAENAVAIGFRAPDTQAAVNIFLNKNNILLEESEIKQRRRIILSESNFTSGIFPIPRLLSERKIPNYIKKYEQIIAPLISYNIGNEIEIVDNEGNGITKDFEFEIIENVRDDTLDIRVGDSLSTDFVKEVIKAIEDDVVQCYLWAIIRSKRTKKGKTRGIDLNLSFKNGKCNPGNVFVE